MFPCKSIFVQKCLCAILCPRAKVSLCNLVCSCKLENYPKVRELREIYLKNFFNIMNWYNRLSLKISYLTFLVSNLTYFSKNVYQPFYFCL